MPEQSEPEFLTSQKSDIYVIRNPDVPDPQGANAFLVVPGTFGVPEDGERIWIRNVTGSPVDVKLPTAIGPSKRIANGKTEPFDLNAAAAGIHVYMVDVDLGGGIKVPAQGGSNPRIVYG